MIRFLVAAGIALFVAVAAYAAISGERAADPPTASAATTPIEPASVQDITHDFPTPQQVERANQRKLMPADTVSLLKVRGSLHHGDFRWEEGDAPDGPLTVWVDLRRQMASVFRAGHEIGTAVVVYGGPGMPTPEGTFHILSKHRDYRSRSYDAAMPYAMFITDDGVALHASPMAADHATHGCIGLPPGFAAKLFAIAQKGDRVVIVRST
ncbi:L,D-transpeptidase family protein [Erythrobacter sp. 3-20A1M]|uniref:L,D-transpeptidase family protein n=1 Tax=Erythrobacter sp. 3-20A1M TaxID=2653850 RepID=UPI002040AA49|nr:L,D-transpeptidase family protein [Erythrobacter sp. 3-20A1M]